MKQATVLIVDDQEMNRILLEQQLRPLGYTPSLAENGAVALEKIRKEPPDLILLDILMPKMDGYEVLGKLKSDPVLRHIPVIMISAVDNVEESVVPCIEKGADDYLVKPFNPTLLRARISSSLEKKRLRDQEFASAQMATIFAMAKLAESRDPETGEHLERMAEYCRILAMQLQLLPRYATVIDKKYIENIHAAAPLHDIGKVGVPDRILQKPGSLSGAEFGIMKTHAILGADTLREVDRKHPGNFFVQVGIEVAESHHEKWDGSGYPHGLVGEAIPLSARILALGDVYDALTSKRVYKDVFTHEKSRGIIVQGRDTHFDPDVVDAFLAVEEPFIDIKKRYTNND